MAAEAEPPSKVDAHFRRTPSRLSWIVGTVQNAAARASHRSRLARQLRVNAQQPSKKLGILQ